MAVRTSALAGLVAVLVASCDRGLAPGSHVVHRDSAGVEIIESTGPIWLGDSSWRLSTDPVLSIGMVEGDSPYLFSNVEGALLRPDGGLVVADRTSSEIRYFDNTGAFEYNIGGPGDGPGEFAYIRGLGRCGADSLFVFEIDYQFKVFAADGGYVRQARPFDTQTVDRRPYSLRCSDTGYFAAVGWEPRVADGRPSASPPQIGFYRAEAPVWILGPHHLVRSGLATIDHAKLTIITEIGTFLSSERIGSATGSRPHPFGRSLRFSVSRAGILLGTGESAELQQYSYDGVLQRIIRWPMPDLAIRPEDISAYRTEQLDIVSNDRRAALERSLAEMPMPPAFPAFTRIELDAEGSIWVSEFSKPSKPSASWLVFNQSGELLGRVQMPEKLEVTDIGSDRLIGIERDDLGVERIVVYEIHKPTSGKVVGR